MRKIFPKEQIHENAIKSMGNFYPEIIEELNLLVQKNDWVVIGMAQNPFVKKSKVLLNSKNIQFVYKEYGSYFSQWKLRLAIKLWTGWPTFPQVFHKGKLIGGHNDLEKYLSINPV